MKRERVEGRRRKEEEAKKDGKGEKLDNYQIRKECSRHGQGMIARSASRGFPYRRTAERKGSRFSWQDAGRDCFFGEYWLLVQPLDLETVLLCVSVVANFPNRKVGIE